MHFARVNLLYPGGTMLRIDQQYFQDVWRGNANSPDGQFAIRAMAKFASDRWGPTRRAPTIWQLP